MPAATPLSRRIAQLKGNMTYEELSDAIFEKTGKRISVNGLQHLGSGTYPTARHKTLSILAEYANRPISWFFSSYDQPMTIAEAKEQYFISTGDPREDKRRRQLYDEFIKTGHEMTLENLEQLVKWAKAIAANDAKYEKNRE